MIMLCQLLIVGQLNAQDERSDYVSDASYIVGTYVPATTEHTPDAMTAAAQAFLKSLDSELLDAVTHELASPERREWTNLPARTDAGGVRFGLLNETQTKAACDLMATLFSEQGYAKMRNIMLADDQLVNPDRPRPGFGTGYFSIVIFGEPSADQPWAFQLDGHHVGVNVSVHGDKLTMSPSFIGTQPQAYQLANTKVRPLAGEVDGGYALVASLSDDQRRAAVVRPRRGRILTGPGNDNRIPDSEGVSCETFTDDQKKLLMKLIEQWTGDLPPPHAEKRRAAIESEIDQIWFSWNGATEAGSDISWRIQGPSLIIEYACQDLGGDPLDHLHTMYRDPTNEYGGQLDPGE